MAKDWTVQLTQVNFRCDVCRHAWEAEPDLIEDAPELEHHPFRYFCTCPVCHSKNQPQAAWARALMKAHQASTGPRTPEGLAKVGKNLEGQPLGIADEIEVDASVGRVEVDFFNAPGSR